MIIFWEVIDIITLEDIEIILWFCNFLISVNVFWVYKNFKPYLIQ